MIQPFRMQTDEQESFPYFGQHHKNIKFGHDGLSGSCKVNYLLISMFEPAVYTTFAITKQKK